MIEAARNACPPDGTPPDTPHWLRSPEGRLVWAWWDGKAWWLGAGGAVGADGRPVRGEQLAADRMVAQGWQHFSPAGNGP